MDERRRQQTYAAAGMIILAVVLVATADAPRSQSLAQPATSCLGKHATEAGTAEGM